MRFAARRWRWWQSLWRLDAGELGERGDVK
jgi:hypothetical protein